MKNRKFYILSAIVLSILIFYEFFVPRSINQMRSSAIYDFNEYVREEDLKGGLFTGPEIFIPTDIKYSNYIGFTWTGRLDSDKVNINIYEPQYRYKETIITGNGTDEAFRRFHKPIMMQRAKDDE